MKYVVSPSSLVFLAALGMSAGCGKDAPKHAVDEPKKTTPVPSDMVFNDFVPPGGGAGGVVGVKDAGGLEGGLAGAEAPGGAAADPGAGGAPGTEGPQLKVIDAGAEPRAPRRYSFVANRSEKRVLTIRQSATREGAGPAQEQAFAITADFTAKAVKPTSTRFEMKVSKVDLPDVPAAQKAQAAPQLAAFNGLTGLFEVTSHGDVGEIDFKADERMTGPAAEGIVQSLQQALELLLPPLPEAPIGVGATWERKVERKERGMENSAKHVFTLKELSADGAVVTADVEIGVPKHPLAQRGAPPGATEEVKGKGLYSYAVRFDRIATKVDGNMTVTQRIEVPDGKGGKQSVATIIKLKNQLDSAGGGGGGGGGAPDHR